MQILRETADRIETGAEYQWSHFGKCNCGHLAQTATRFTAVQIHRSAFCRLAEWSEIPEDFCPQTGALLDRVVDALFELGLNATDLRNLEDLSDGEVLRNLPGGFRYLERNQRQDAVAYMRSWANLLEAQLYTQCADPIEAGWPAFEASSELLPVRSQYPYTPWSGTQPRQRSQIPAAGPVLIKNQAPSLNA
ncbi:MAG TPA: hypothetical protein VGY91_15900 [Chthoniobacterales bacterium]|nr:hypothetical protein [Chthoniobacterales bacterium]